MVQLRLRSGKGQSVLNVDATATLATLKELIAKETQVPPARQSIKCGFPPKEVTAADSATLESVGIKHGETLVLEVKPEPPSAVHLVRHGVPDDNSCLFASIKIITAYSGDPQSLRTMVVHEIQKHPEEYSEAVLGKVPDQYCSWILKKDSWGGAIELAIFAEHFSIEIVAVDIKTLHVYRYGEDRKYPKKAFVIYDGIHYDPIVRESANLTSSSPDPQLFPADDEEAVQTVVAIAAEAKKKHQYTDTASFTLRCSVCKIGLVGEKEAQTHAKSSGHTSFEEYLEE